MGNNYFSHKGNPEINKKLINIDENLPSKPV